MPRLLSQPIIFVAIYVGLVSWSVYPSTYGGPIAAYVSMAAATLAFILQVYWARLSLNISSYSSDCGHAGNKYRRVANHSLLGASSVTLLALFFKAFFEQLIASSALANAFELVLIIPALFLWLRFFWLAARSLCDAEERKNVPAIQVFGTFLLYVYLVIGAFFLSKRLERLAEVALSR